MSKLPAVLEIIGVPHEYAWGSPTAIPRLLGIEPDGRPVAELWFGAHEADPSPVPQCEATLLELIQRDPSQLLGADVTDRFGPRMPFLVKLLAAETALSIQVHPDLAQARAGFADEQSRGVAGYAPHRTFKDANHKPEMLCALTQFEALCGFRAPEQTLELIDLLECAELAPVRAALADGDLRGAFTWLLSEADTGMVVPAVVERAATLRHHPVWSGAARAVAITAADFPGDVGVALSLLLNYVRLEPREAMFLGAGNVHCYLRGLGVEVMANSDNVVRCGLTPKHVDVDALLGITDFRPLLEPRVAGVERPLGRTFAPVTDFCVVDVDLAAHGGSATGWIGNPTVVVCTAGQVRVEADGAAVVLRPGRAAFLAARDRPFQLAGDGAVYLAATPPRTFSEQI